MGIVYMVTRSYNPSHYQGPDPMSEGQKMYAINYVVCESSAHAGWYGIGSYGWLSPTSLCSFFVLIFRSVMMRFYCITSIAFVDQSIDLLKAYGPVNYISALSPSSL